MQLRIEVVSTLFLSFFLSSCKEIELKFRRMNFKKDGVYEIEEVNYLFFFTRLEESISPLPLPPCVGPKIIFRFDLFSVT